MKFRIHELNPLPHQIMDGMLELLTKLNQKISQIDKELLKISQEDREVRLLMTTPGVGLIVALIL